ncbi:hypothetical protein V1264_009331 [Littorina saxatilis]|uniref:Mutator-like transposase domain-containing protein n=1 Tax=Littorina saxatilis TaxID=31220 RepID=A0AAN9ARI5_9CAEN
MGKRKASYTPKRRKFNGNRHSNGQNSVNLETDAVAVAATLESNASSATLTLPLLNTSSFAPCASSSKLKESTQSMEFDTDEELTGFRFVDIQLLVDFVSVLLCPLCKEVPLGGDPVKSSVTETRTDLASQFAFHCGCGHAVNLTTSKLCNKVFEVNRRFPLSVFAIGCNQKKGKRFLGNMNMPSSLHTNTWANHREQIRKATEAVSEQSKDIAAEEVRVATGAGDVTISGDGTYQRRGFQSKNAVFTTLSVNGKASKVLNTEVLSNHCDACKKKETSRVRRNYYI